MASGAVVLATASRITSRQGAKVTVGYVLTRTATVTLDVLRRGKTVAHATARIAAGGRTGRNRITWNAKIGRRAAATGAYTLVLRARSADGQTASDRVPLKIRARRAP